MQAPFENHSNLFETLLAMPKVDLHRHLEGSLRLQTIAEFAAQHDLGLTARTAEELRPLVQITENDRDFRDFLRKFDVLRRFYHSPEAIRRLAYEAVADAALDNVRYLELRFTPMALAKARGYPLAEVSDWVIEAVEQAQADFGIQVRLIASFNRHEAFEIAEQVTGIAADRLSRGIAGLDLAGDEVNFGIVQFAPLYQEAEAAGLGLTAHTGEWMGPEGVRVAIERLGVDRIGHGVRASEDPAVMALAVERDITFEVCLTSNVQTGAVSTMAQHPLRKLMAANLRTTLNSDDPCISDVTLTHEYYSAVTELGLQIEDIRRMILTAAESAFLPRVERAALVAHMRGLLANGDSGFAAPTWRGGAGSGRVTHPARRAKGRPRWPPLRFMS
jgi:adenosine deaminase